MCDIRESEWCVWWKQSFLSRRNSKALHYRIYYNRLQFHLWFACTPTFKPRTLICKSSFPDITYFQKSITSQYWWFWYFPWRRNAQGALEGLLDWRTDDKMHNITALVRRGDQATHAPFTYQFLPYVLQRITVCSWIDGKFEMEKNSCDGGFRVP